MTAEKTEPEAGQSKGRADSPPRHLLHRRTTNRALRAVALTLSFVLLFGTTALGIAYSRLNSSLTTHDINDILASARPSTSSSAASSSSVSDPSAGKALNIVVIGSDSREGENDIDGGGASGATGGMRSDTTMLVHISADRSRVEVVSIPRDTLVDIPSCPLPDGSYSYAQYDAMFNSAFATGAATGDVAYGAACTILTIESMTGLTIDDFVVVDFTGFVAVIDAIGGVPMYFEEDLYDESSSLDIAAGCRLLNGEQALAFARARKNVGDGSDISRIGRQQELVEAVLNEVLSTRLLTNPSQLYQVIDTSVSTLTTSTENLGSLWDMVGLASSLSGLTSDGITTVTMPFDWAGARVTVNDTYASQVWAALAADSALDADLTGAGYEITERIAEREAAASASPAEIADPSATAGSSSAPTTGSSESEATEATDPASQCTRETAS